MLSCAATDIGKVRSLNEDYVFASDDPVGRLPNLFVVADGMGGHRGGDYASRFAVERFVSLIRESERENPIAAMNDAIAAVNAELYWKSRQDEALEGMGTTMVTATVVGTVLYVANVGDSRLYQAGEELHQITRDHSWVEEMVSEGRMERGSAAYLERKNIITRAVGISEQVTADFFEVNLRPGERILLCSDGLTNMVDDGQILEILHREGSLAQTVESLIAVGKANGGQDNISVILVNPEQGKENVC